MAFYNNSTMNNTEETKPLNPGNPAYSYDEVFPALPGGIPGGKVQNGPHPMTHAVLFNNQHDKMRINSSEVTQILYLAAEERKYDHSEKFGESESLRLCAQITKETGAKIEISTSKDKSLTFLITGKKTNVGEAQTKLLQNFQTQANVSIHIPKEHHRWILGKNGQRLKDLEKKTGTKISIPSINDPAEKITVVGSREGIEKAVHEIRVISDEQSKKAFERVSVPKIYYPFITGARNELINQLSSETNTRINVPPPSVENYEITIAGEKEGVENAKNRILQIYHEMEKTCQTISVEVPRWQHKYVFGHKGSTMSEILQKTGVSVEAPPVSEVGESITITLRGPCKVLGEALQYLFAKVTSMQAVEIDAPAHIHKLVIGKKAAFVRELSDTYKQCHVEFISDSDKIRVECLPDFINEVKQKLEEKVYYFLNEYDSVELDVDQKHFKYIIGKSGGNVNRLKSDHDVSIMITDDTKNSIKIEGAKDHVAQVRRELEKQIKKLENEREIFINIDPKHHRSLTANKREKLREFQDKVTIIFPGPGETSDLVKIKGQKEDVNKCKEKLSKIVKELNENSYTIEVPIYKQFHKCIIGRGGANIKKIRDETNTKIDLPSEIEESDTITITGRKENVEDAKERILKIQKEMAQIRGMNEDSSKSKSDFSSEKSQPIVTVEIKAKPEHHKFLIGKNGTKIKKIRESTGAKFSFPNEGDEDKELITITGKKDSVEKAKEELEAMIEQINNTVEEIIHVNPKYHKNFINSRGELVNKISEGCGGVTISFPRLSTSGLNESAVTVKGNVDNVREAIRQIKVIVEELDNKLEEEIQVIPRYQKHFMERKREVLQNIIQDCGGRDRISINFPPINTKDSRVVLKGAKESVQMAKEKILEIVKDLEEQITVEVDIPNKDHKVLRKSMAVDDIRKEYNVKISFPSASNGENYQQNGVAERNGHIGEEREQVKLSDTVYITGKPENCEAAKQKLLDIIPVTVMLNVDPEYHPQIIGRKGEVINKIRSDHNVTISLPKKENLDNIITISGFQDDVEAAKTDILNIVQRLESRYREEVSIDRRVHPRMIGTSGRLIRKIMSEYDVEIRFPRSTDPDPNIVIIYGEEEKVADCKDHLLHLEDEFVNNIRDDLKYTAAEVFDGNGNTRNNGNEAGFVVKNAPWDQKAPDTTSIEEFPTFGNAEKTFAQSKSELKPAWGPRR